MEYKRIFKDGMHLLTGNVGSTLVGFLNLIILARILTTEEMGKYSLFLMLVNLAVQLGLNWSDSSILRHGREEFIARGKINKSFWARFYLYGPMCLLAIVAYVIFHKPIADFIGISSGYILILIICGFLFSSLLTYITSIYRSVDQIKKSSYMLLFQKAVYFFGLIFILFNKTQTDLIKSIIFFNLSFMIIIIINLILFNYKIIKPYEFDIKYFKKIWKYSWPQLVGFPAIYIVNYIDIFVIKLYMTVSDVGVYDVAYKGYTIIIGLIMIINTLFLPLIVEYKTKKRYDHIKKYVQKIPLFTAMWIIVAAAGMLLSKHFIPILFSTKYVNSIPPFNILMIGTVIVFASTFLTPIFNAYDFIMHLQAVNIVMAATNLVLDFILVPKLGIIGAAYATVSALIVSFILKSILIIVKRKEILGVAQ